MQKTVGTIVKSGLCCLLWVIAVPIHAQTFTEDMLKVKDRFNGPLPMRATVEVKYFKNENDASATLTKRGLVKKAGTDRYYSFFDGKEYLINKKYTLLVDRNKKLIVLKDTKSSPSQRNRELSVPEINKEQESGYTITRSQNGERISYTLASKTTPDSRLQMELDAQGSRLLKVVYYGGNSYARTEITYTYPQGEVTFADDEFSENRYITKTQNAFVPAKAYSGYELNYQTR